MDVPLDISSPEEKTPSIPSNYLYNFLPKRIQTEIQTLARETIADIDSVQTVLQNEIVKFTEQKLLEFSQYAQTSIISSKIKPNSTPGRQESYEVDVVESPPLASPSHPRLANSPSPNLTPNSSIKPLKSSLAKPKPSISESDGDSSDSSFKKSPKKVMFASTDEINVVPSLTDLLDEVDSSDTDSDETQEMYDDSAIVPGPLSTTQTANQLQASAIDNNPITNSTNGNANALNEPQDSDVQELDTVNMPIVEPIFQQNVQRIVEPVLEPMSEPVSEPILETDQTATVPEPVEYISKVGTTRNQTGTDIFDQASSPSPLSSPDLPATRFKADSDNEDLFEFDEALGVEGKPASPVSTDISRYAVGKLVSPSGSRTSSGALAGFLGSYSSNNTFGSLPTVTGNFGQRHRPTKYQVENKHFNLQESIIQEEEESSFSGSRPSPIPSDGSTIKQLSAYASSLPIQIHFTESQSKPKTPNPLLDPTLELDDISDSLTSKLESRDPSQMSFSQRMDWEQRAESKAYNM